MIKLFSLTLGLLLFLLSLHQTSNAQNTFQMTIGGEGDERAHSIIKTPDGGYALGGYSTSYGNGSMDAYIVRLNESFEVEWSKNLGGTFMDQINDLVYDPFTEGFIYTGQTNSFGQGFAFNLLLGQLNADGELLWSKANGGLESEIGYGVVQLPNKEIFVAGTSRSYAQTGNGAYLFKTTANGNPIFGDIYDNTSIMSPPASDNFRDIILCQSEEYIYMSGMMKLPGRCIDDNQAHNFQFFIMKADLDGNEIWHTFIGGGNCREAGRAMTQTADGHIVVTGLTQSFSNNNDKIYLTKVNSETGELIWTRIIGVEGDEIGKDVVATHDGGTAITGWTESTPGGQRDVFLVKTDINGDIEWSRTYGTAMQEEGHSLIQTDDNGFLIAGYTSGLGNGGEDIFLIKTDEEGRIGNCDYETIQFTQTSGGTVTGEIRKSSGFAEQEANPIETFTMDSSNFISCCPVALFSFEGECVGESIKFLDQSEGDVINYKWDFGDGNQSNLSNPEHVFQEAGLYIVSLVVSDAGGCTDSLKKEIQISNSIEADIQGESVICKGETVELSAIPNDAEYIWNTGDSEQAITVAPDESTTYSVIVTDSLACGADTAFFTVTVLPNEFRGMSNARDTVLRSHVERCDKAFVIFKAELDFCGPEEDMKNRASWKIDLNNNGTFDFGSGDPRPDNSMRNGLILEEYLPFGTHLLEWTFESPTGEIITEQHLITVVDNEPPTPVCIHGIAAAIMPQSGMITLPAFIWDRGSWDNCTVSGDLTFSFSSDHNHLFHTWTCDDLQGEKELNIPIEIWVTDESGHQDYCITYILLQDNQDGCPDIDSLTHQVSGLVLNPLDEPIGGVTFKTIDEDENITFYESQTNGLFSFDLTEKKSYTITADRSTHPLDGISTLDLVLIQKHILGQQPLDNPYSLIAADVNGDKTINVLDIHILRDHILGNLQVEQEFPQWKIISEMTIQATRDVPEYETEYFIPKLTDGIDDLHFRAIKMGDVNASAFPQSLERSAENFQQIEVFIKEFKINAGDHFSVSLKTTDAIDIYGLQASFSFDVEGLEFLDFYSPTIPITEDNFGFRDLGDGRIYLSWNQAIAAELKADEVWLTFDFAAKKSGDLRDFFFPGREGFSNEIYEKQNSPYQVKYIYRDSEKQQKDWAGHPKPNPFSKSTSIPFEITEDSSVELFIYDLKGKTIHRETFFYPEGKHDITIKRAHLNGSGVYIYQLRSDQLSESGRLMFFE